LSRERVDPAAFEHVEACVTPVLDLFEAAAYPHNAARRRSDDPTPPLPVPAPRFGASAPVLAATVTTGADEALARWRR